MSERLPQSYVAHQLTDARFYGHRTEPGTAIVRLTGADGEERFYEVAIEGLADIAMEAFRSAQHLAKKRAN